MRRSFTPLDSSKRARVRSLISALTAALSLVAVMVLPSSSTLASAASASRVAITCNAKRPHTVGTFVVSCGGSGGGLVSVTASVSSCASSVGASRTCDQFNITARFHVEIQGINASTYHDTFSGGTLTQLAPVKPTGSTGITGTTAPTGTTGAAGAAGAAGTTTTAASSTPPRESISFNFSKIEWSYTIQVPGKSSKVLEITVTPIAKHGLFDPSLGIQDSKNIADGAAKGQAVD